MAQIVKDGEIVEEEIQEKETTEETETEEPTEQTETEETEPEESEDQETEESDDEEALFWQEIDKEDDDDGGRTIPLASHIRKRDLLKGRISEKDDKIAQLNQRISELEKGQPVITAQLPKRPKPNDYENDEDYEKAVDDYENKRLQLLESNRLQREQAEKAKTRMQEAVNSHYQRADTFVSKFGIAPEKYKKADISIRSAVDSILPKQGDLVTDQIISVLGEGSEKVLFRVGAKPELLHEFQSLLLEDKSGLKAAIFLGRQQELITNPKKRQTMAPKPSRQIKGDLAESSNEKALRKAYNKAHEKGNTQDAYNAKKKAKAAGVDVSSW